MRPNHAQAPRAASAAPEMRLLRSVHPPAPQGDGLDPGALADLVAAPGMDVAGRARAALSPLLAHDALVLVTPASSGFPVQIAAPRGLRVGLAAIEWGRMTGGATTAEGTVARLPLPPIECGLDLAAWVAVSGRLTVALVVLAQGKLELDAEGEDAAMMVAMLAAARARRIDGDPPPGTLGLRPLGQPGARARPGRAQRPSRRDALQRAADAARRRLGALARRPPSPRRSTWPRARCWTSTRSTRPSTSPAGSPCAPRSRRPRPRCAGSCTRLACACSPTSRAATRCRCRARSRTPPASSRRRPPCAPRAGPGRTSCACCGG